MFIYLSQSTANESVYPDILFSPFEHQFFFCDEWFGVFTTQTRIIWQGNWSADNVWEMVYIVLNEASQEYRKFKSVYFGFWLIQFLSNLP